MKKCYSVKEAAQILSTRRQTVYKLIREGVIKAVLLNQKYWIIKADFDTWLNGEKEE